MRGGLQAGFEVAAPRVGGGVVDLVGRVFAVAFGVEVQLRGRALVVTRTSAAAPAACAKVSATTTATGWLE